MTLEKQGVPTATIVTSAFLTMARAQATSLGIPDLPLVVIPHPFADLRPHEVAEVAARALADVVQALTGREVR